ncbi:MAG: glycogen debranching protein GlgX [Colwellia sp.]|nr:glycogen debranching protein GlgX [Colwellia sp.]
MSEFSLGVDAKAKVAELTPIHSRQVLTKQLMQQFSQGRSQPLGASLVLAPTKEKQAVNFAVYSPQASQVELCLFDNTGKIEIARLPLHQGTEHIWHGKVMGIGLGQLYGFRAHGENKPELGLHFNPNNLLIDPYAKDLQGQFSYPDINTNTGIEVDTDNATLIPKSRVVALSDFQTKYASQTTSTYQNNHQSNHQNNRPNIPWSETVIYECHVKGATINNLAIDEQYRGKFLGLAEANFIEHLKGLGVTTLELLPVHSFISERFLIDKKLTNYWGYNSVNFFTPQYEFLSHGNISEFQSMVYRLHQHNIEVIIDVVFNHTAEGNEQGQILNLRGLANSDYYRLDGQDPSIYINDTGCGNTLNLSHPRTLQLIMDSLRYWVEVMGVDGFRFDLAPILARDPQGFNYQHSFFQSIAQDPILNQVKLIAEPWDIGPGGYQLGAFPIAWREWNDKYRDTVRRFWRGEHGQIADLAQRLHGSHDLFAHNGRDASASINFITAHDGFTLADLVSFQDKHNDANGEENRDGHNDNYSQNNGIEGETDNVDINALRLKQQKNMLFTLLFSQGVPMLSAGMEQGHSQQGNNNAYCQDNEMNYLSFLSSSVDKNDSRQKPREYALFVFIRAAIKLRKQFKIFQQSRYIHPNDEEFDWLWLTPNSDSMTEEDWQDASKQLLICLIVNKTVNKTTAKVHCKDCSKLQDNNDALLMVLNASSEDMVISLPQINNITFWQVNLHSMANVPVDEAYRAGTNMIIPAQSVWLMCPNRGNYFTI